MALDERKPIVFPDERKPIVFPDDEPGFFGNLFRTTVGAGRDLGQGILDLASYTEESVVPTALRSGWIKVNDAGKVSEDGEYNFFSGQEYVDYYNQLKETSAPGSLIRLPKIDEPTAPGLPFVRDILQFAVPFSKAKYVNPTTWYGKAAEATARGAAIEQAAFSPYEQRISNLIQSYPALQEAPILGAMTEYLQADPNDTEATARFKMALEGAAISLPLDGIIEAVGRVRAGRKAKQERAIVDAENAKKQEADQTLIETAGTSGYTGKIDTVTKRPGDIGKTVEDIAAGYVAPAVKGEKKQKVRRDPFKLNSETNRIGTKIKGDQYDIVENADGTFQPVKMDAVNADEFDEIVRNNPFDDIEIERLKTTKVARPIGEPVSSMQSAKDAIVEFTTVDKLPITLQTRRIPTGADGKELPRVRSLFAGKIHPDAPQELAIHFWGKNEKILPTYKLKGPLVNESGRRTGYKEYDEVQTVLRENNLIPDAIPGRPDIDQEDLMSDLLERNPYIEEASGGSNYENWYRDTTAKEQIIKRLEDAGENPYRMTDEQVERTLKKIDENEARLEKDLERFEQENLSRSVLRDKADEAARLQSDTTTPATLSESIDLQTSVPRAIREQEALRLQPKDGLQKQIAEEPTIAGNINLQKLDAPTDVKQMIKDVADDNNMFLDARQNVVRFGTEGENLKALADETGLTIEKLLQREKGEAFNFATAYAARVINAQSAKELVELAKKAESTSASQIDLINFENALAKHAAIQEQISGITAEAGRALAQFRYMAKADALTQDKMITEYLLKRGGDNGVKEIAGKIANMDTTRRVSTFASKSYKPNFLDKVQEVWINGLLSSPSTHIVNVSSNTLVAALTPIEYAVAAAIGAIKRDPDRITGGEVAARTFGTIFGTLDGLVAAARALKDPDTVADSLTKLEMRREKAVKGLPGEVVRLPGRALVAEDVLFKTIGYTQEMWGQSVRQAQKEGKGLRRAKEILKDPDSEFTNIKLKAIETGRYQTFTNNLEGFAQSWQRFIARNPGFRFLTPFVRTPYNIVTYAFERTPFARLQKKYKDAMEAGGPEADLANARMYLGTSVGVGVAMLAADGIITGRGPSDPRERAVLMETGWQPYSVKIGDTYYGYNRFEPVGIIFGVSADLAEIASTVRNNDKGIIEDLEIITTMLAASITENITNKTFLTGITDAIEAIGDPDRYLGQSLQRFFASSIPTVAYYERKAQDPYLRDVRSLTDAFMNRIPGQSQKLPFKRNILGEPRKYSSGSLGKWSPTRESKLRKDPIFNEFVNLGYAPSKPSRQIGGVDLTTEQYDELLSYQQNTFRLRDQLVNIINSPKYKIANNYVKTELLDAVIKKSQAAARNYLVARHPSIAMQRVENIRQEMTGN